MYSKVASIQSDVDSLKTKFESFKTKAAADSKNETSLDGASPVLPAAVKSPTVYSDLHLDELIGIRDLCSQLSEYKPLFDKLIPTATPQMTPSDVPLSQPLPTIPSDAPMTLPSDVPASPPSPSIKKPSKVLAVGVPLRKSTRVGKVAAVLETPFTRGGKKKRSMPRRPKYSYYEYDDRKCFYDMIYSDE